MSEDPGWVAIARIVRAHALKGIVILKPLTRSAGELMEAPLERVYLRRLGKIEGEYVIESLDDKVQGIMAAFVGVDDRTAAEKLVGCEVVIPVDELWPLPEGRYYFHDLEGLRLIDKSGAEVGRVTRIQEGGGHDFIVFANPTKPGREVLLPHVPEFVHKVDLAGGTMTVTIPEGLFDL